MPSYPNTETLVPNHPYTHTIANCYTNMVKITKLMQHISIIDKNTNLTSWMVLDRFLHLN